MKKSKSRIYICHTFYHVYVSILKEMKVFRETTPDKYQRADIALSAISTDFEDLGDRLKSTGIFGEIFALDEKREDFFPELAKYRASNTLWCGSCFVCGGLTLAGTPLPPQGGLPEVFSLQDALSHNIKTVYVKSVRLQLLSV